MHIRSRQTTWVVFVAITTHYPHTKFRHCSPIRSCSGYLPFLLLANQNRYANEVLNMRIWWRQNTWVVLVSITTMTTHIPSFITVAQSEPWIFAFCVISQSEQICKWGIKGTNGRQKTYEIFHVYCIFYSGFTCQTTVIFGITKDGSLVLNTSASWNCFTCRNLFQNGANDMSEC